MESAKVKDLRYNKNYIRTKIAECECGQRVLLEDKRLAWDCPKCKRQHALVFKTIKE